MAAHDPAIRLAAARKAALTLAANRDAEGRRQLTASARDTVRRNLLNEIDPDGELARTDPKELEKRYQIRLKLRMAEIGLKSAQQRARDRELAKIFRDVTGIDD